MPTAPSPDDEPQHPCEAAHDDDVPAAAPADEAVLDEALKETFPASDPISPGGAASEAAAEPEPAPAAPPPAPSDAPIPFPTTEGQRDDASGRGGIGGSQPAGARGASPID